MLTNHDVLYRNKGNPMKNERKKSRDQKIIQEVFLKVDQGGVQPEKQGLAKIGDSRGIIHKEIEKCASTLKKRSVKLQNFRNWRDQVKNNSFRQQSKRSSCCAEWSYCPSGDTGHHSPARKSHSLPSVNEILHLYLRTGTFTEKIAPKLLIKVGLQLMKTIRRQSYLEMKQKKHVV